MFDWNPAWDEFYKVSRGLRSANACRVRAGNSCGSGSIVGVQNGGSLVMTNAHVVGSRVGTQATCQFDFGQGDVTKTGRIIMAAYSSRVTADWAILFIPDFQPIAPAWGSRARPTSQDRFYTTGSPSCVWPLRNQNDLQLISNNNAGFAVWNKPAIGGQSGSGVWNSTTHWQQLLLTWRTGNGNGAGQPLDYIYNQGRTAIETGTLQGGAMPDGVTPLCETNPDVEEGFFCELSSIRELPIWMEDQKKVDPPKDEPGPGCEVPAWLIESTRKIRDDADSMLRKLESAMDFTPTEPPAGGPTFGL